MPRELRFIAPDAFPEVGPGDDLAARAFAAGAIEPGAGDIVIVAQKIVSKSWASPRRWAVMAHRAKANVPKPAGVCRSLRKKFPCPARDREAACAPNAARPPDAVVASGCDWQGQTFGRSVDEVRD